MKHNKILLSAILLIISLNTYASDELYNWKFIKNTEIKELTFKNKNPSIDEDSLREIISSKFVSEFCSKESEVLNHMVKDIEADCKISKIYGLHKTGLSVDAICLQDDDITKMNLILNIKNKDLISGLALGNSTTEDFNVKTISNIRVEKSGSCLEN
ncbi:hypothetical protein GW796_07075 [archaeon]|nr:hypothetical protein [archaeon]